MLELNKVYCGDCRELMRDIPDGSVDAVVTDPPYGIGHDCDYTRFTGGLSAKRAYRDIECDERPFDPEPFLTYKKVVLFGANCFSDKLPCGSWLVWIKKRDASFGTIMSDAEVAWMSGGHGVYVMHHEWNGFLRESEREQERQHPTQKPVAVMAWVMEKAGIPAGATILDPFLGSGTTAVAALKTGRNFIGIEIDPKYCEIAQKRVDAELAQTKLAL